MLYGLFGMGLNAGIGLINNRLAEQQATAAREANYHYGELAAQNADTRTRALYKDLYSPKALMKQYKEAGLSPSMMFGGTPGQGGMAGAQGTGTAGQPTAYMPISLMEGAQLEMLKAQAEKTKAETENVKANTEKTNVEKEYQDLINGPLKDKVEILTTHYTDEQGNETSLFEIANNYYTFEGFLDAIKNYGIGKDQAQIEELKSIYMATHYMRRDIITLSQETVSNNFQLSIIRAMEAEGFADWNAKAAIGYLKANVQTAELTETQKEAWNNLISKLGKEGSTTRDIIVVLGMILNQAASNWHMPNINISGEKHQYKLSGGQWKEY